MSVNQPKPDLSIAKALDATRSSYVDICWAALKREPSALSSILPAARTSEMYRHVLAQIRKPNFSPVVLRDIPEAYFNVSIEEQIVNAFGLEWIPESLRSAGLCEIAVRKRPEDLDYVPPVLRTSELCACAVEQDGRALEFVPDGLKSRGLCEAALQNDFCALHWVPEAFKTYEICLQALEMAAQWTKRKIESCEMDHYRLFWVQHLLEVVPQKYRDSVMCNAAMRIPLCFCNAELVPEELRTYQFWLWACRSDCWALSFVPTDMVDEALCRAAVESSPKALRFVPPELIDEEMCRKAVSAMPEMLAYVPEQFCTLELCLEAVTSGRVDRSDGTSLVLRYVPEHLRTKGLCMAAVLNQPKSIQFVPEELRDQAMYEKTVLNSGYLLAMVPEKERTEDLCITAVLSRTGGVLKHVPDRLKTPAFCRMCCRHEPSEIKYVPKYMLTPEFSEAAVQAGEIEYVPKYMLTPEFCEAAVLADWHALTGVTNILFGHQDE